MLKERILNVINSTLSELFIGIRPQDVQWSFFGGSLTIRNLRMKHEIFKTLSLPVECGYFHIGSLKIDIPWFSITKKPVVIEVNNVVIVLVTKPISKWNVEQELLIWEGLKKLYLTQDEIFTYLLTRETEFAALKKFGFLIAQNASVTVNNIEIRYEDSEITPDHPWAIGLTAKRLRSENTDWAWRTVTSSLDVNPNVFFKKLVLEDVTIYVDNLDIDTHTHTHTHTHKQTENNCICPANPDTPRCTGVCLCLDTSFGPKAGDGRKYWLPYPYERRMNGTSIYDVLSLEPLLAFAQGQHSHHWNVYEGNSLELRMRATICPLRPSTFPPEWIACVDPFIERPEKHQHSFTRGEAACKGMFKSDDPLPSFGLTMVLPFFNLVLKKTQIRPIAKWIEYAVMLYQDLVGGSISPYLNCKLSRIDEKKYKQAWQRKVLGVEGVNDGDLLQQLEGEASVFHLLAYREDALAAVRERIARKQKEAALERLKNKQPAPEPTWKSKWLPSWLQGCGKAASRTASDEYVEGRDIDPIEEAEYDIDTQKKEDLSDKFVKYVENSGNIGNLKKIHESKPYIGSRQSHRNIINNTHTHTHTDKNNRSGKMKLSRTTTSMFLNTHTDFETHTHTHTYTDITCKQTIPSAAVGIPNNTNTRTHTHTHTHKMKKIYY
eukprot:GHVR01053589.1.p1 GENE.GHVR01053589.1~~GHVR01053589.1.p1  ORF type:complete len:662 (-),score=206.00 GHVR01053589.1:357-2342(-)